MGIYNADFTMYNMQMSTWKKGMQPQRLVRYECYRVIYRKNITLSCSNFICYMCLDVCLAKILIICQVWKCAKSPMIPNVTYVSKLYFIGKSFMNKLIHSQKVSDSSLDNMSKIRKNGKNIIIIRKEKWGKKKVHEWKKKRQILIRSLP